MLSLRVGAASDIGRSRKNQNEDSGYAGPHLIVVADGMGGAPAGDLASAVAIQTIKRLDVPPPPSDELLPALAGTILIANERLAELMEDDHSINGMGTTVTAALFDGARIGVAHLGDSRGYLWRDGTLQRITRDHSWVQSLVDEGRISEEQAMVHSHRSLVLKVLDGRQDNEPDLSTYDVQSGDRVLICSDGLSGFVAEEQIASALATGAPQSVALELLRLALESGSTDNITVLVGDVVDGQSGEPIEPLVVGAAGDTEGGPLTPTGARGRRQESEQGEALVSDPELDPEQLRYAPRAPRRFLVLRRAAILILTLAIIGGGLALAYQWTQTQYFVAANGSQVAIYQGVNADLPGITLNHVYQDQPLKLSQLPPFRRTQVVDGLSADSLPKARQIVAELLDFAKECAPTTSPTAGTTTITLTPPLTGPAFTPPTAEPSSTPTTVTPPPGLVSPMPPTSGPGNRACSRSTPPATSTTPAPGTAP